MGADDENTTLISPVLDGCDSIDEGEDAALHQLKSDSRLDWVQNVFNHLLLEEDEVAADDSPDFNLGLDEPDLFLFKFDDWIVDTAMNDFNSAMLKFFSSYSEDAIELE